ncbi:protein ECERIFERUM 16 isoform X2 [Cornus florida]|uniref:protein ECERIFERUM 16 isoform X2 n=1 Tax=Cornus florida TaxID=4283 RepID=UPI0028A1C8BB|nr:protein ECERIFERUM 16 isoform X2 [Cornus florida]
MDAKALAKSKRAHSQHLSKKHNPTHTPKVTSGGAVGTGSANKPLGKQVRGKSSRQSQGSSALPSNWDRYEEEYELGSEGQSSDSMSQATDIIVPKSKGADFAYLISEAKSQSQTNITLESFPSLDDVLTDFNQGVESLLSVKGQSLLSWMGDDNFIVEDRATATHEASFLSLNLHSLAEQLAKVDLSQRLFIEADLLPPELCSELQESNTQESDQDQATYGSEAVKKDYGEPTSHGLSQGDKNVHQYEVSSSQTTITITSTSRIHPVPISANKGSKFTNQVKDDLQQFDGTGKSTKQESVTKVNVNSDANPKNQQSRFEAADAEAELDMLLDSFNETKLFDSSGFPGKSGYTSDVPLEGTSTSLLVGSSSVHLASVEPLKQGSDLSKSALVTNDLDGAIDDLVNITSNLKNQNGAPRSHEDL